MKYVSQILFALIALSLLAVATILAAQHPVAHPDAALDDAQVRAIVQRAIAMQHHSDATLDLYDRTERVIDRDDEKTTETTFRTVPLGASNGRVALNRDGQSVPKPEVAQRWQEILNVMESRTHTDDPAVKKEYERAARRKREAAKMVDAIAEAFDFRSAGRAVRAGRQVIVLDFQPNPAFKSKLRFSGVYKQIWGRVWVDEASGYVVRLEAELRRDIPIGGGIVGKIYQGSRVELEQAEAPPGAGVWLPTFTSYDIEFRKFVFPGSYRFYATSTPSVRLPDTTPARRHMAIALRAWQSGRYRWERCFPRARRAQRDAASR